MGEFGVETLKAIYQVGDKVFNFTLKEVAKNGRTMFTGKEDSYGPKSEVVIVPHQDSIGETLGLSMHFPFHKKFGQTNFISEDLTEEEEDNYSKFMWNSPLWPLPSAELY